MHLLKSLFALFRKDCGTSILFHEDEDESNDEEIEKIVGKKKGQNGKKGHGRKAQWTESLLNDMVDIIVSNDYLKNKLIFTNSKNQKNSEVYQKVLNELKKRTEARGEDFPFTVKQLRTKFKKVVGECKKAALVMRTASGIKRFQDENGYGAWFNQLFALVKTRDSCQPEQAIEPSAVTNEEASLGSGSPGKEPSSPTDLAVHSSSPNSPDFFVPVKRCKKATKESMMQEVVGMLKKVADQDPMKEFLEFAREEADKARRHELHLVQLMMGQSQQMMVFPNHPTQQQSFYNYVQNDSSENLQYYQL